MKSLKVAILSEMQTAKKELRKHNASDLEDAVHSFRRRCKRVRAYLRLMPSSLEKQAERARTHVREAAASLSELRDSQVTNRMWSRMHERVRANKSLEIEAEEGSKHPNEACEEMSFASACDLLRSALNTLNKGKQVVESMPARQRRGELFAKFHETYKAARRATKIVMSQAAPEDFHDLRKYVKQFYFQCQFVQSAYGKPLHIEIDRARILADMLGEAMDLVVLAAKLGKVNSNKLASQTALFDESQEQTAKLFHESRLLACQLFFETSKAFEKRIE